MNDQTSPAGPAPQVAPIQRQNIPALLKGAKQWINWRVGRVKASGKFDKVPVDPQRGKNINPHDPKNWLAYDDALSALDGGVGDGIGFVMSSDTTMRVNGEDYYLAAIDIDNYEDKAQSVAELKLRLGNPYVEKSPSGRGLRMFVLSDTLMGNGNDGNGHEIYFDRQFVTVTGTNARGKIKEATAGLQAIHQKWFPAKPRLKPQSGLARKTTRAALPETEENIARFKDQLSHIPADVDYGTWRNIVWGVLATGWECALDIAREWSLTAEDRFDEGAFELVASSFDPEREGGVTYATVIYHAKENGWNAPARPGVPVSKLGDQSTSMQLLTPAEIKDLPYVPYLVKGLLPAQGVAAIYGEPGSGKSFLAMDLAFSVAAGLHHWFGMKLKRAPVAYIALEGRGGVGKRLKAWEQHRCQLGSEVRFVLSDFNLKEEPDVDTLASAILEALGYGCLVVVDTLNQSAPGADENNSSDMSRILTNAKKLGERVRGLVLLVHHSGKDRARGMRGHSSLNAAMDATIEVTSADGRREWKATKAKDDELAASRGFDLLPVDVGIDEDDGAITSCAVEPNLNLPAVPPKKLSGKNQTAAMTHLRRVITRSPDGIAYKDALSEATTVMEGVPKRRPSRAKEAIEGLIHGRHLKIEDGKVKLA